MRKTLPDLTKELSEKLEGIETKDIERVIEGFIELTKSTMTAGEVVIRGFGKFFTSQRGEKKARNPHTGEEIMVPARLVPRCKFSNSFSKDIKDGKITYLPADNPEIEVESEWYVALKGKAVGPHNKSDVLEMLKKGKINEQTLVYNPEIGGDWTALGMTQLKPVVETPVPLVPPIPSIPPVPAVPKAATTKATKAATAKATTAA